MQKIEKHPILKVPENEYFILTKSRSRTKGFTIAALDRRFFSIAILDNKKIHV